MSASILSVIQHYQRSIEHSQDDESRLLHCINKLYRLPVKVAHLQETGVGKTVNSLRKYNGEIGVAAKALVTKWKAMVAAEEEPTETNAHDNDDDTNNGNGHDSSDGNDDQYRTNSQNNNDKTSTKEFIQTNTTSKTTSKDRQREQTNQSDSEYKTKIYTDEKSSQRHSNEHSSSKHKRPIDREENGLAPVKKIRNDQYDNENVKSARHKSSQEKSERHHDRSNEKTSRSNKDDKTTFSHTSQHRNGSVYLKEKKDSQQENEKQNDGARSSKHHQSNDVVESTSKQHSESVRKLSPKEVDKKERLKENKHDRHKSSSKDASHRNKHHKSSTSHSSNNSSKPSTEEPTSSTSDNTNIKGSSKKRKSHHVSDSSEASPSKSKIAKTSKSSKQKPITNNNESDMEDVDDGIDSSMGANFADVLGMLNMPSKKSKKLLTPNKSPTVSTSSKYNNSDKPSCSISSATEDDNKNEYKPSSTSSTSKRPIDEKPELLASGAKLAPLDPAIALELPTISTNYKPLPHNKTVMECIYRNSGMINNAPKPPVRTLTDAEAISHGISSKTMRTKIYSGIKTGQLLQVPSLFDLCIRILQKNIDALEYTGGVPFDVLRPVLERATPHQLLTFEEYNPYLMEDSDCLWQIHVQRSFRCHRREELESWREMFLRCEEEKERKLNSLTETIKKSQKIITAPLRKTQLAFVDTIVKPPRNILRKQEQFGTREKLVATPAARVASLSTVAPNAAKVGDTRLRVAATVRDTAQVSAAPVRSKKAPLMAKTLQFIRGRHKR